MTAAGRAKFTGRRFPPCYGDRAGIFKGIIFFRDIFRDELLIRRQRHLFPIAPDLRFAPMPDKRRSLRGMRQRDNVGLLCSSLR